MPDSFIDKLRMNGIFTPNNMNPVSAPDLSAGGINMGVVNQGMATINPWIEQAQDKKIRDQKNMMLFQKSLNDPDVNQYGGRINQIGNSMNDPNQPINQQPKQAVDWASYNTNPITGMSNAQSAALDFKKYQSDETNKLKQSQLTEKSKNDQSKIALGWDKNAQGWDKNDIARGQQAINKFRAEHPNAKTYAAPGGNLYSYDPVHGWVDSGIDSGLYTSIEEMEKKGEIAGRLETQKQTNRMQLGEQRGGQQLGNIAAQVQGRQDLQNSKPIVGTPNKVEEANRANQLRNQRPELAPYIEIDQDGRVNIVPPSNGSSGWFGSGGPSLDEWNEINRSIYGSGNSTIQNNGNVIKSPTTSQGQGINTSPSSSKSSGKYKVG